MLGPGGLNGAAAALGKGAQQCQRRMGGAGDAVGADIHRALAQPFLNRLVRTSPEQPIRTGRNRIAGAVRAKCRRQTHGPTQRGVYTDQAWFVLGEPVCQPCQLVFGAVRAMGSPDSEGGAIPVGTRQTGPVRLGGGVDAEKSRHDAVS